MRDLDYEHAIDCLRSHFSDKFQVDKFQVYEALDVLNANGFAEIEAINAIMVLIDLELLVNYSKQEYAVLGLNSRSILILSPVD